MKARMAAAVILLLAGIPALGHRLDEYLQAALIAVAKEHIQAQIRLTPGVAVFPIVLASIDTDGDGVVSKIEQRAYAERVLRDLSLSVDGDHLQLRLVSMAFPTVEQMQDGLGEIRIEFDANVPRGGRHRRLIFENHHQSRIAAYLVNCLVPRDPDIQLTAQQRNYQQSFYQLDYRQAGIRSGPMSFAWWSGLTGLLGAAALLLSVRVAFHRWRRRDSDYPRLTRIA
jgi:hypothetical protein